MNVAGPARVEASPKEAPPDEVITPEGNPFQLAFLACAADLVIAGGGAGCGKSYAILLDPLRWIHVPGFKALVLRRQEVDLDKPDSPWVKSFGLYPKFGGKVREKERVWTFPSGAQIYFGFIASRREEYERQYQGVGFDALYLDELTHFTRSQFRFLLGRNRRTCTGGPRPYVRATCNPDRDSWVRELVDWWLGPDPGGRPGSYPLAERCGRGGAGLEVPGTPRARYYIGRGGEWVWADSREELLRRFPRAKPEHVKSVQMIPGKLSDNRHQGDEYEANLLSMEEHLVEAWLHLNWDAGAPTGKAFRWEWFKHAQEAPPGTRWCRPWDLASTPEAEAEAHHSYSAGPKVGLGPDGRLYIADLRVGRWDAGDVELQLQYAAGALPDPEGRPADGPEVLIWICQERGSAGKREVAHFQRLLPGYRVEGAPETGKKGVRLRPLAAMAKAGHVVLLPGVDQAAFRRHVLHLELEREVRPDDVGDALAAGHAVLTQRAGQATAKDLAKAYSEDRHVAEGMDRSLNTSGAWGMNSW